MSCRSRRRQDNRVNRGEAFGHDDDDDDNVGYKSIK
jgi:hypothetical protein